MATKQNDGPISKP